MARVDKDVVLPPSPGRASRTANVRVTLTVEVSADRAAHLGVGTMPYVNEDAMLANIGEQLANTVCAGGLVLLKAHRQYETLEPSA